MSDAKLRAATRRPSLAHRVSAYNRTRKWSLFLREIAPTEQTRILDVGYSDREFSTHDNFLEKHYPHPGRLTALGTAPADEFKQRYPQVSAVQYDGRAFPFADQSFDVCWSNAVLEHVGDHDRQLFFLQEIRRVARRAFLTTPNRYFPVEVHTLVPLVHYLPKRLFDRYLGWVGKSWAQGDFMHLLSRSDLERLLRRAGIDDFRVFRNRIAGLTLDFVVVVR